MAPLNSVYSTTLARTTVTTTLHITVGFGHGGVLVVGTLYDGVDGTLI